MELSISSPCYFRDQYGIDDEVWRYCQKVYLFFRDKKYSETLNEIGISPVAAPKELLDQGYWKEEIRLWSYKSCAHIFVHMDFEEYYHSDSLGKIEQTQKMILQALKRLKGRVKFDHAAFEKDLLSLSFTDNDYWTYWKQGN